MGGKSEERKIAETQSELEKEMFEEKLLQELGQLRGIQLGQEESLQRAQKVYNTESDQFRDLQKQDIAELSGTPQEITQLQEFIREKALPEQQQALRQTKVALTQAGVRGPDAALQAAMASSRMGTDLARATQEVALRQALEDRSLRQKEYIQAGAKADWFYSREPQDQLKTIENMIDMEKGEFTGNRKKAVKATIDFVEDTNSSVENGVRFASFKAARDQFLENGHRS